MHYDQVGTLRAMTDSAGVVVKEVTYDSFGNVLGDTRPGISYFAFAGGLYDGDTGLVRFGYRDYDAKVGVWTAKDPIGFEGGDVNLIGYCSNNPINLTDPNGQAIPLLIPLITGSAVKALAAAAAYVGSAGLFAAAVKAAWDYIHQAEGKKPEQQPKPKGCPPDTRPIDKAPGMDKGDAHNIKNRLLERPTDWVGITPDGDVITADEHGNAVNNGPKGSYLK